MVSPVSLFPLNFINNFREVQLKIICRIKFKVKCIIPMIPSAKKISLRIKPYRGHLLRELEPILHKEPNLNLNPKQKKTKLKEVILYYIKHKRNSLFFLSLFLLYIKRIIIIKLYYYYYFFFIFFHFIFSQSSQFLLQICH